MNYPVWELYASGGGLLIAIIAVIHVYIAHFAVGGGLYLVLCEQRAHKSQNIELFAYLKKHTRFFMLLTMVFGGVTGVGIWFTMSLLSPEASSVLIHQFVFAWAVEWIFFTCEIIALFIYYYSFDRIQPEIHIRIGWFYFGFAWLSLFVVNGIISFMITPGQWLETGNFWHGLFNPGFLPSLLFRTALTIVFAGIFGVVTASALKNDDFRNQQFRFCGKWILSGLLSLPVFAHFYFYSLPDISEKMIKGASPEIQPFVILFLLLFGMLLISGIVMFTTLTQQKQKILAYSLLIMGLLYMGSFEWIREASRKPYIIYNYLYANQQYKFDTSIIKEKGILKTAKWSQHKTITSENKMDAGHELFLISCSSCHSIGGPINDILPLTQKYSITGMRSALIGQGKITPYMPEFLGSSEERNALAHYIVDGLHQKITAESQSIALTLTHSEMSFNDKSQNFVLLAWPNKGMHLHADSSPFFNLGASSGTIQAQLIKRGEVPEHVTDEVEIIYHCDRLDMKGSMFYDDISMSFVANDIHASEFANKGLFNPYPIITIEARDIETQKCLAKTQLVFAISSAMGCKNCHGGNWKNTENSGVSKETAEDILKTHDRISGTSLLSSAQKGTIISCEKCHQLKTEKGKSTKESVLNLSASMHGFHANYIDDKSEKACTLCHAVGNGKSLCFRGVHTRLNVTCVNCHGSLNDHALGLLKHENMTRKENAIRYMKHLTPNGVEKIKNIQSRKPWVQEPDCKSCHVDFQKPDANVTAFNQWNESKDNLYRNQMGDAGIRCIACHGAPHVIYPTWNQFDLNRDNLQPLQYQSSPIPIGGNKHCRLCHMIAMDDNYHHDNMLRKFRNNHLIGTNQ